MPGMTSAPRKGRRDFEPANCLNRTGADCQKGSNSHVALWSRTCKVFGPQGPSLRNRMSELLTYGSVGGGGREPASYPASSDGPEKPNSF